MLKDNLSKGKNVFIFRQILFCPLLCLNSLNVTKYLSLVKDEQGTVIGARVRVTRLRGEPSYGLTMPVEDPTWSVGHDVADHYGITKWEPPLDCVDGDAEHEHPAFHKYFNLENINNFPNVIQEGEECVFTEKIHGKNCRLGLIRDTKDDGTPIWRFMAGSHDVRRKEIQVQRKRRTERNPDGTPVMETVMKFVKNEEGKPVVDENGNMKQEPVLQEKEWFFEITRRSQFWEALDTQGIKDVLLNLCNGQHNVVIFAELYGTQDMLYGLQNLQTALRVFDITIDGKYMSVDEKIKACTKAKVQMVPFLYRGPFSMAKVNEYVTGPTTLCAAEKAGPFKGREGIVITSVEEHSVAISTKFFTRASVKSISFEYLERKEGTEFN